MTETSSPDSLKQGSPPCDSEDGVRSGDAGVEVPREQSASRTAAGVPDSREAVFADKLVLSLALILLIFVFTYLILVAIDFTKDEGDARRVGLLVVAVIVVVAFVLWKIPRRQVAFSKSLSPEAAFTLENEARKTLAQILGGVFLLVGVYGTLRSMQISEEGQFGGRFDKATEQLGSEKQHVRSSGIVMLKSLSKESATYKRRAREVLASYIRDITKYEDRLLEDVGPQATPSPMLDGTAGPERGKNRYEAQGLVAYLGDPDLGMPEGIDLSYTDLSNFLFARCLCYQWIFFGARLDSAQFESSNLRSAVFEQASLKSANFSGADLSHASFKYADLSNAVLDNALLDGTDLSSARNLTLPQIEKAQYRQTTILPPAIETALKNKYLPTPTPLQ